MSEIVLLIFYSEGTLKGIETIHVLYKKVEKIKISSAFQ